MTQPPWPGPPEAPSTVATVSGIGLEDGGVVGMLVSGTVMTVLAVVALVGAMLALRSRRGIR